MMRIKAYLPWSLPLTGFAVGWLASMAQPAVPAPHSMQALPPAAIAATNPAAAVEPLASESAPAAASRPVPLVSLREAMNYSSTARRLAALMRRLDEARTPADFAALHAELVALQPFREFSFLQVFFRRWAQVAPIAALAATVGDLDWCWVSALTAWAERDPAAAIAWGEQHPRPKSAEVLRKLRRLGLPKPGELPPAEAVRRFRERMGEDDTSYEMVGDMSAIFREWAKTDPEAALREALAMPANGFNEWMTPRRQALSNVIKTRAASDPADTARLLEILPEGEDREMMEQMYVGALIGGKHTKEARDYAFALPDGPDRRAALAGLASRLFDQDAEAGEAVVNGLSPEDWKAPTVFFEVLRNWISSDPHSAGEMLLAHLPPDIQATAKEQEYYKGMFFMLTNRDPQAATELVVQLPEGIRGAPLEQAIGFWCGRDASAASQWAGALPAGPARDQALQQVAVSWAGRGATEVTQWLDTLPADSGRDAAVEGFARTVMSVSPDDALAWLRTVPDETDRFARLRRVWQNWADRAAAQKWLDASTDLTAAERAALEK